MHDELKALNDQVLATFGQPVVITRSDTSTQQVQGIISKELVNTGQFEGVLQEVTVISLDSSIELKRGDQIQSDNQQWNVDRKLKDDGHLAYWNLHEARS
ncbi:MAG: head-tail joining protein [Endozoicomonas sp.]